MKNNTRYTIQTEKSGKFLYWNGKTWVAANGSYTQANDNTTFNTNYPLALKKRMRNN